jgi:hypothetical protein
MLAENAAATRRKCPRATALHRVKGVGAAVPVFEQITLWLQTSRTEQQFAAPNESIERKCASDTGNTSTDIMQKGHHEEPAKKTQDTTERLLRLVAMP